MMEEEAKYDALSDNLGQPQGYREAARRVLEDMIEYHHGKAAELRLLLRAIRWEELTSYDEELLWGLFTTMRGALKR